MSAETTRRGESRAHYPVNLGTDLLTNRDVVIGQSSAGESMVGGTIFTKVHLHVGDAFAGAALSSAAQPGTAAVIIDPHAHDITVPILEHLHRGSLSEKTFDGLLGVGGYPEFRRHMSNLPPVWKDIRAAYKERRKGLNTSGSRILLLDEPVGKVLKRVPEPADLVDRVTCYFPDPRGIYSEDAFLLAAKLLKQDGTFELVTESEAVMERIQSLLMTVPTEDRVNITGTENVSIFDIANKGGGRMTMGVINRDGKLYEHLYNNWQARTIIPLLRAIGHFARLYG